MKWAGNCHTQWFIDKTFVDNSSVNKYEISVVYYLLILILLKLLKMKKKLTFRNGKSQSIFSQKYSN